MPQPPPSSGARPDRVPDAFDTLGLPPKFDVASADIQAAYLARSRALHPDAIVADATDPSSEEASAALNEARTVLENPEWRAEALLTRLGGPRKEQDRSLPPAFLAEMLQVREEIEAAGASENAAEVQKWERWADDRRRRHIERVTGLFRQAEAARDKAVLQEVRRELNMWRYVERLIEQLDV